MIVARFSGIEEHEAWMLNHNAIIHILIGVCTKKMIGIWEVTHGIMQRFWTTKTGITSQILVLNKNKIEMRALQKPNQPRTWRQSRRSSKSRLGMQVQRDIRSKTCDFELKIEEIFSSNITRNPKMYTPSTTVICCSTGYLNLCLHHLQWCPNLVPTILIFHKVSR